MIDIVERLRDIAKNDGNATLATRGDCDGAATIIEALRREVARLQDDVERHIEIASQEAQRADALEKRVKELEGRCSNS